VIAAVALAAYTNLAGRVIAATPVKVEREVVTFDCGAQGLRQLSLGIFPAAERQRIKAAAGIREVPDGLKGLAAEIASQRARYEARARAGKLSQEKLAENLEMLSGGWVHAVDETNLPADEKAYWKENAP